MKKVIVRLGNGLGNQLFTYAAAYSFARKNNAELYVDNESGFYKRYRFELHSFNISAQIVQKKYKFLGTTGRLKRKIIKLFSKFNKKKVFLVELKDNDKLTYFNAEQFNIQFKDILYFEGYFQSDKYFESERKNIAKEFTFKDNIIKQNSPNINLIRNSNSISIHFRQDKFLPDEGHDDINKLNSEYIENNKKIIEKGINYFDKLIDNPKYFVWSNNFDGMRNFFPSEKFVFVEENIKKDPAYDLFLMSQCKHFIMSPSTMHYWAAYLSSNKNKICLAPTKIKNISGYYGFSNNKDIKAEWWKEI